MQDIIPFIQHHTALVAALVAVLVVLIILEFLKQKQNANRLSPAQAVQYINHKKGVVVDIRNYDAYLSGHIVGAISLPLNEIKDKSKKIEKFKSQPIIIACANGQDSPRAAHLLMEQGFLVHILAGGLRAWRDADMPLVKDSA